jgi:predicted acetyltransferase
VEEQVLEILDVNLNNPIPTSIEFRQSLELETTGISPKPVRRQSPTTSIGIVRDQELQLSRSNDSVPPQSTCLASEKRTKSQGSETSSNTTIVLNWHDKSVPESRLEWSARMKRYQEEEIEYLGLEVIKPKGVIPRPNSPATFTSRNSLPIKHDPKTQPTDTRSRHPPCHPRLVTKQRFEDWLDTLNPRKQNHPPTPKIRSLQQEPQKYNRVTMSIPQHASSSASSAKSANLSKQRFEDWLDTLNPRKQNHPPTQKHHSLQQEPQKYNRVTMSIPQHTRSSADRPSSAKSAKLSKQRFEDWLDTLNPKASPASQPDNVPSESENLQHSSDSDTVMPIASSNVVAEEERDCVEEQKMCQSEMGEDEVCKKPQTGKNDVALLVDFRACAECVTRSRSRSGIDVCDKGVQTEITGGLIVF